jgi:IS5 family transposase
MNGFERYTKKTRRQVFLEEMEQVVPWRELCGLIEPHYPKPGNGRPPVGVERMLRIYFLQQWFNLSDPAVEEALYDSGVMRQFTGIDLGHEPVPDETTVCKFRHLLEEHQLGEEILGTVNLHLQTSVAGAPSPDYRVRRRSPFRSFSSTKWKNWKRWCSAIYLPGRRCARTCHPACHRLRLTTDLPKPLRVTGCSWLMRADVRGPATSPCARFPIGTRPGLHPGESLDDRESLQQSDSWHRLALRRESPSVRR